ncbi:hypothetical protein REPUB_Repub09cG0105800 [Reevesia pubescens]
MLDSGNFVLYNSDQEKIWESFKHPTTLFYKDNHSHLFSSVSDTDQSTGLFRLNMLEDGNLVQYPTASYTNAVWYAYWASGTVGAIDNVSLNLDNDGRLYLLNSTGFNIKVLFRRGYDTYETIYLMKLDPDGIFRIYSYKLNQDGNQSFIYESSSDRFTPVKEGNSSAGCGRDFSIQSCNSDDQRNQYTIQAIVNTEWEDVGYSELSSLTREDRVLTYKKVSPNNSSVKLCENFAHISFSFAEIEQMTNSFKEEIGKGAFGTVFKGTINSDSLMVVAVKRLDKVSSQGELGFKPR